MIFLKIILTFSIFKIFLVKCDNIANLSSYYKMPHLYYFDDYDRCLRETSQLSTYCFVRTELIPNETSKLWKQIHEYSNDRKRNFNHEHLYFGTCVNWCQNELQKLDNTTLENLYGGLIVNNSIVNSYVSLFKYDNGHRQRYNNLLNKCINLKLESEFNLKAITNIEYCNTNRDIIKNDLWNCIFYFVLMGIILATIFSSIYDFRLNNTRNEISYSHYKSPLECKKDELFTVFSFYRNWYRLNQEPSGKLSRDLRFLDCFKFFAMFLVVFAHSNWVIFETGLSNPQDSEQLMHTFDSSVLLTGPVITVTFFVISGVLLAVNYMAIANDTNGYITKFIQFNIFRYIRLTIPYAFMILVSGVQFNNIGGPVWKHVVGREQLACRKNWWTNLLYLNVYVNADEHCMFQGWYLAADAQAFFACLLILMVCSKFPKFKKLIFSIVIAISFIIPGYVAYDLRVDGIFIPRLQLQRDAFMHSEDFKQFYAGAHTNFGCYFFGVLAAISYLKLSAKKVDLKTNKMFLAVWWALLPAGVVWMLTGYIFVEYDFKKPSLWIAIYSALQRNVWGLGLGTLIVGLSMNIGGVVREFCCHPIFRILGRLTYGVFIIHLFILRITMSTLRQPIFFDVGIMFVFVIFGVTTSYLCSFLLAIFVELPVSAILKYFRNQNKRNFNLENRAEMNSSFIELQQDEFNKPKL